MLLVITHRINTFLSLRYFFSQYVRACLTACQFYGYTLERVTRYCFLSDESGYEIYYALKA